MPSRTPEAEPLLTPSEVATMFRVSQKTVTRWAQDGRLTSIRTLGGHRRYREHEVRALLADVPEPPTDPLKAPLRSLWPATPAAPEARLRDRLQCAGLATVGDLTACDAGTLSGYGVRPAQVDQVRLVLARKGFTLYGEILGAVA